MAVGPLGWRRHRIGALLAAALLALPGLGAGADATPPAPPAGPLLLTGQGEALQVGPYAAAHAVGLLANGERAIGVAVAPDGAFLAFTCGIMRQADTWFAGDWYRG